MLYRRGHKIGHDRTSIRQAWQPAPQDLTPCCMHRYDHLHCRRKEFATTPWSKFRANSDTAMSSFAGYCDQQASRFDCLFAGI
jgi:hypothetical protein